MSFSTQPRTGHCLRKTWGDEREECMIQIVIRLNMAFSIHRFYIEQEVRAMLSKSFQMIRNDV